MCLKLSTHKFLLIGCLFLAGCARSESLEKFSRVGEFFGSTVRVDVCHESAEQDAAVAAVGEIWERFADIHRRLSVYDSESDLSRINRSYPQAVTVGADTYSLISDSIQYHSLSGGVFDITIYPLLKVWKTAEKRNVLPTPEEIHAAQALMGPEMFEMLDDHQIRLKHPGVQLSIDSIGDGYAADEAGRILRRHGFKQFLIDASGELLAGGVNCEGRPWSVGVKDPQDPQQMLDVLNLKDESVTTSGSYGHFYTIAGQQYSHIIHPQTGFPRNDILSVTVIAPNTQFSDFLSTALCLMDPQKGMDWIDSLGPGHAAMIVAREEGQLIQKSSRYYPNYLSQD